MQILQRALEAPLRTIAENSGVDAGLVKRSILKSGDYGFGYDALAGKYGDMFEFGIIDPTKVVRTALENAASVSSLLLSTSAVITDKPKKEGEGEADMEDMDY